LSDFFPTIIRPMPQKILLFPLHYRKAYNITLFLMKIILRKSSKVEH